MLTCGADMLSADTVEACETDDKATLPGSDTATSPETAACYYVYWIQSGARAYIGATVDPRKRLRQHNGELAGGARRTHNRGPWHFECVVSGFRTWREALQYEWAAKHHSRRCRSMTARRAAFEALNAREQWTSNSPLATEVPLKVEHAPTRFGAPPLVYHAHPAPPRAPINKKSRAFVRRLHGVRY